MNAVELWHEWTNRYQEFYRRPLETVLESWDDPEGELDPEDYFRNQFAMHLAILPNVLDELLPVAQKHSIDPSPVIDLIGDWQSAYRDTEKFDSLADAVCTVVRRIEIMESQNSSDSSGAEAGAWEKVTTRAAANLFGTKTRSIQRWSKDPSRVEIRDAGRGYVELDPNHSAVIAAKCDTGTT